MNFAPSSSLSRFSICRVHSREVYDSRGWPTVETEVTLENGCKGRAIVPAGASTGSHEATDLRDEEKRRHQGRGVSRAVENVNSVIGPALCTREFCALEQSVIDAFLCELDATPDKSKLGANAILSVSLAVARAAASATKLPLYKYLAETNSKNLPVPLVNIISGGKHAGRNLDMQDFQIIPICARTFRDALDVAVSIYHATGDLLREYGYSTLLADEGGFGPSLPSHEHALNLLLKATENAGYKAGANGDVSFAIDVAATQLLEKGAYRLKRERRTLTSSEMIDLLETWINEYPIVSIEDGLSEDDWEGWRELTQRLGTKVQLIGDDLFTTNPDRFEKGVQMGVANAVLVKMNQIGTLTESMEIIKLARKADYRAVVSARSGETEDTTIADLAVATGAEQIKIGSVARSERLAKYNELLRIEEEEGFAIYPSTQALRIAPDL
jgi:enolase